MLGSISFISGILLAAIVLAATRRKQTEAGWPAPKPTALGWWTLASGLTAIIAFTLSAWLAPTGRINEHGFWLVSIAFSFAAVVTGIGNLRRGDRHWPTWAGLVAGLVPAMIWIAFTAGHIFGPGD